VTSKVGLPESASTQILSGWKDIASYLRKGVRTVQRYERVLGLPVRRPAGKPRGSVVATKVELDAWVMASPFRESYQLVRPNPSHLNATAEAIKDGVAKMGKLREEINALRADVRESVDQLQKSVRDLLTTVSGSPPSGPEEEGRRMTETALGIRVTADQRQERTLGNKVH